LPKVIYLTGAPAAGKSSTTQLLLDLQPNIAVWEYGAKLTEHCMARRDGIRGQDDLRARSSGVVTPQDVAEVDAALLEFVTTNRGRTHVLIDSHPVTKEPYGYRITPFSLEQFCQLRPDEIWVLYASPEETRRRIAAQPGGRPLITEEEARAHTMLQASVAATYGMAIGCPIYMFDTGSDRDELVSQLVGRLS
jgi:adenylate kinase